MKKFLIALVLLLTVASLPCEAQYSRSMSRHYNSSRNHSYGDMVEVFVTSPGELADRMPKDMYDRVRVLRIDCKAIVPPELDALSSDKVQLFVPAASVDAYRNAKNWKKVKNINPL